MIFIVTTHSHAYTHEAPQRSLSCIRRLSYPYLLSRRSLPHGTYIFGDLDRLNFWQLELAAHVFQCLKRASCRVLNDPARVLQRLALLRRLRRDHCNSFQAWPASEADTVDRFPVFLRTAAAHRGNLTDLLESKLELLAALEAHLAEGFPIGDLIIVEYKGEAFEGDVFRKLSMFRLGDRLVSAPSVHERHWAAKHGEEGVAGEAAYALDLEQVRLMPHSQAISRAFEISRIDYGRADFSVVEGKVEVYEINTNPFVTGMKASYAFASRQEAAELAWRQYLEAMANLDSPEFRGRVTIPTTGPRRLIRRRWRWAPGYLWLP